ncbi:Serine/threonine protein phosphatase PP2A-1 catalytic subunit, putative [Brugia malayi]|nr:Serine/threonine protein phosphatase PP2A-1 catalytic subunit, putative [Brugia malayi]VIO95823.1 Serine/threonine protein phosphatase PP2A-1 catalytic subunit, putative [Brugia malayi]
MVCYHLTQEILEKYMCNLMKVVETNSALFPTFSDDDLITILHNVQDIYADEPIMLQFDLPKNGLIVVGDLHGDLYCLLNILLKNGFPPNTKYLFLGDYVDRGLYQVQLILFIFLMKLRWPNYITTLKGNHEDYQCGKECDFYNECLSMFKRGSRWFTQINHVFDHMPVCAIISNHFFVCHGGISQWMTCRSNVGNIPKPTYTSNMHFVEGVILADLLWADPKLEQQKWFDLSRRNCGYSFNRDALNIVLRALKVKTLIRGHEYYPGGTTRNFGDDTCYTVHSTTDHQELYDPFCGTLKLEKKANKFEIIEKNELIPRNAEANQLAHKMQIELQHSFFPTVITYDRRRCHWCERPYPLYVTRRKRCFAYGDILDYMMKNGKLVLFTDKLIMKLSWRGTFWRSISAMKRAIDLFPLTHDIIFGRPSDDDIPRSFRVCLLEEEFELMKKIYKVSGKDIDTLTKPNFRNISDVEKELQMPVSRFQKLKKRFKLAMGLEPHDLDLEDMMTKPTALPSLSFDTVGNADQTARRMLNTATDEGSNEDDEVQEEPDEFAGSTPSNHSSLFYQRTRRSPLADTSKSLNSIRTHNRSKNQ